MQSTYMYIPQCTSLKEALKAKKAPTPCLGGYLLAWQGLFAQTNPVALTNYPVDMRVAFQLMLHVLWPGVKGCKLIGAINRTAFAAQVATSCRWVVKASPYNPPYCVR